MLLPSMFFVMDRWVIPVTEEVVPTALPEIHISILEGPHVCDTIQIPTDGSALTKTAVHDGLELTAQNDANVHGL
ncbi:hypothetical protein JCM18750_37960 [Halostagnicola bangensis]